MADYIVGDIQGCYDSLQALLDKVNFNPQEDILYCVGDLVNRGPKSLETLRFIKNLGAACRVVLGNHDLHLLSVFYGIRDASSKDTLTDLLNSSDADELINWLRFQPLMIHEKDKNFVLSHAGIYPKWDLIQALEFSKQFSSALQADDFKNLLVTMYGNSPSQLSYESDPASTLRFTVNAFTRMRFCSLDGDLSFNEKGSPNLSQSTSLNTKSLAWFQLAHKRPSNVTLFFGHWSTLGLYQNDNLICLDTGCAWGNKLSLYDFDTKEIFSVESID